MALSNDTARFNMVEQQVRTWEVLDPRILDAFSSIHREDFVPAEHRRLAFADMALPLAHGEQMFKPVVEGRLLQGLDVQPHHQVLEVGTGSGFMTACLARLARSVHSIDIHADFVEQASKRLANQTNVTFAQADAYTHQLAHGFDRIFVGGASHEAIPALNGWLNDGGIWVGIIGQSPVQQAIAVERRGDFFKQTTLFETDVPYLVGGEPPETFDF